MEAITSRSTHVIVAVISVAAIVAATVAAIATSPRGRPHGRTLDGRVVDETGGPVPLARVCAVAPVPRCTFSGPNGDYHIDDLPSGELALDAGAPRYVVARHHHVPRSMAEHAVVDVDMRRGGRLLIGVVRDRAGRAIAGADVTDGDALVATDNEGRYAIWSGGRGVAATARGYARHVSRAYLPGRLDFTLVPEATLAGIVVDATTDKPAAGVHVTLAPSRGDPYLAPDATTDAYGRFRVTNLEPGSYVAAIDAPHAIGTSEGDVAVTRGQHVDGVVIRAMPAHEITGRVIVEPSGATCTGPTVVVREPHRHEDHVGSLDDTRTIHIGGLMPGSYDVDVECEHHLANAQYDPITITDRDVTDQRWTVTEGATIEGHVTSPRAEVSASNVEPRDNGWTGDYTIASATGEFELHGLRPGAANVTANAGGLGGAPASREVRVTVDVSAVAPTTVNLVLEPSAGAIAGRLVRADGTGIPNVPISARDDAQNVAATANTDAFGGFAMDALAGDYHLACDDIPSPGEIAVHCDGPEHVRVSADHTTTVELRTPRHDAVIRGRVLDDRGRPVTDATVELWGPDVTPLLQYLTDEVVSSDGSFVARELDAGTYTVSARRPGGGESALEHVASNTETTLTIEPPGSIAAVVRGAPPVERFDVELVDLALGAGIREDVVVVANGRFTLSAIPAGRYRLFVTTATAAKRADIEVVAGKTTPVELELDRFVTIVGRVLEVGTDRPLSGIEMGATPLERSRYLAYFDHATTTDASGKFAIHDVERGELEVKGMIGAADLKYPWVSVSRTVGADAGDVIDLGDLVAVPAFDGPAHAGMTLANRDGFVRVIGVEPHGPAAQAGIVVGDVITAVDGVGVVSAKVAGVEKLLRGPSGVQASVTLQRGATVMLSLADR